MNLVLLLTYRWIYVNLRVVWATWQLNFYSNLYKTWAGFSSFSTYSYIPWLGIKENVRNAKLGFVNGLLFYQWVQCVWFFSFLHVLWICGCCNAILEIDKKSLPSRWVGVVEGCHLYIVIRLFNGLDVFVLSLSIVFRFWIHYH